MFFILYVSKRLSPSLGTRGRVQELLFEAETE